MKNTTVTFAPVAADTAIEAHNLKTPYHHTEREKKIWIHKELTDEHFHDRRSGTGREYLLSYQEIAPEKQEEDMAMSATRRTKSTMINTRERKIKRLRKKGKMQLTKYLLKPNPYHLQNLLLTNTIRARALI